MRRYKKFLIQIVIVTLIIFIAFGLLNLSLYKSEQSMLWINNSLRIKENYAKSINENKIVFTAGSNVLFGINTETIQKELKIPTVNMAVHAGLKADYIIYRTKKILKSGDLIIMPLEYHNFTWDGSFSEVKRDYLLTYDKDFFHTLPILSQLKMLYSITPNMLLNSLYKQYFKKVKKSKIGENYNSDTLNKHGDETYKKGSKNKVLTKNYKAFKIDKFYKTQGLKSINQFAKWCKKNNINFYISFPNTINLKDYHTEKYKIYFQNLIHYFKKNNIDFIGKPTDSLYPKEYFYDSNYHLNLYGSQIRTKKIIELIKRTVKYK